MERVFQASKAFFSLSQDAKMSVKADKNNGGYTPMHEQVLDPENQTKGDTKEGFYISRDIAADSEDAAIPLCGLEQWPSEHLVPGVRACNTTALILRRWKATMQDYHDRMHALRIRLSGLLSAGLWLGPAFFEGCFSKHMSALRLLRYYSEVSGPEKGVLGAGAHSDFGMITMLGHG
ncbi:unnamed protein product [Laminaria digitata]